MTTATKIRRNKDGHQKMSDLRADLAATKHFIHRVGNDAWVVLRWSEGCQAFFTHNMHPFATERQAIQVALYGEYELDEYAAHFAV